MHNFNTEQTRLQYASSPTNKARIKGFAFPLNRNDPRGFFYRAVDYELIRADLIQLILTEPGERVMMPNYGTGLRSSIFEQGDQILYSEIRNKIINSINRWEPRIVVRTIDVRSGENENNLSEFDQNGKDYTVIIQIDYSLKDNLEFIDRLVLRSNFNSNRVR